MLTYPHPLYYGGSDDFTRGTESMKAVTLKIDGMSCDHCVRAVRQVLEELPQVDIQSVEIGRASLHFDNDSTDVERILAAIQEAGYRAEATVTGSGEAPGA